MFREWVTEKSPKTVMKQIDKQLQDMSNEYLISRKKMLRKTFKTRKYPQTHLAPLLSKNVWLRCHVWRNE
jgi:hypothetical protein